MFIASANDNRGRQLRKMTFQKDEPLEYGSDFEGDQEEVTLDAADVLEEYEGMAGEGAEGLDRLIADTTMGNLIYN